MTVGATLQRCFGDVECFERCWGVSPLVVRRGARGGSSFEDVLSIDRLDEWMSMAIRIPAVRVVDGGVALDPARYCTPTRLGGRTLHDVVDPNKVADLVAGGATVVAQSLHRTMASVSTFVDALQREVTHPVQANAYLTPPSATGLAPHADRHDVIVFQVDGRKAWWVEGLGEVVLSGGDVMYVPLGVRHRASTSHDMSLHLTVGVIRVTPRQMLERLVGSGPDSLDDPFPIGYRHTERLDDLVDAVVDALDDALDVVGNADPVDLAVSEQERRLGPPAAAGRIASIVGIDRLDLDTVVRWVRADPMSRIVGGGDDAPDPQRRLEVRLDDRVLSFPISALPALVHLGRGVATSVAELPGLDERSRVVLARRLVREGACIIEPRRVSSTSAAGTPHPAGTTDEPRRQ